MVNDGKNWEEKGFSASDEKLVLRMSKITWNPIKWASVSFTSLTQNSYLYIHFKIPVLGCRIVDFFSALQRCCKSSTISHHEEKNFVSNGHQASKPGNKKGAKQSAKKDTINYHLAWVQLRHFFGLIAFHFSFITQVGDSK